MRLIENRRARSAFLVVVLFTLLAGDAWRYTLGWAGWGVIVGLTAVASVFLLIVQRSRWRLDSLPYPLIAFLGLTAVSIVWSFYPGASALGVTSTWFTIAGAVAVAVTYSWDEIVAALGMALRFVLGLSLTFEFAVSVIIRHPVLPPVAQPGIDYANLPNPIPPMLYWSRNQLFDDGKIQGIVGNSALLSLVALLGIIVFGIQLADRARRRRWSILWLAVAVVCFVLTRAATNIVGLVVVLAVVGAVLLVRRAPTPRSRGLAYGGILIVAAGALASALVFFPQLLTLLGKSADLTNRGTIWTAVIDLAQQRPVFGWGWVSYWVPWVAPFDDLAKNNGVRQLHAHNAWLDIWLQLGIVGLVVMGALVLSTLARSWSFAVDRPQSQPARLGPYTASTLLPLLVLVALVVQSVAESRLLVEYGMFLLALIAVKSKRAESVSAS
jgi:exopolysaccharide production protein ExoQ